MVAQKNQYNLHTLVISTTNATHATHAMQNVALFGESAIVLEGFVKKTTSLSDSNTYLYNHLISANFERSSHTCVCVYVQCVCVSALAIPLWYLSIVWRRLQTHWQSALRTQWTHGASNVAWLRTPACCSSLRLQLRDLRHLLKSILNSTCTSLHSTKYKDVSRLPSAMKAQEAKITYKRCPKIENCEEEATEPAPHTQ